MAFSLVAAPQQAPCWICHAKTWLSSKLRLKKRPISLQDRSLKFLIDTNLFVAAIKRGRMRSTEDIRKLGIEALAKALGPVDAVRFLQSFDLGRGDYTKEPDRVLSLELGEIVLGVEKRRKRKAAKDV